MYTLIECAKMGLFVLALLTTCIFALEGCLQSEIKVINDEIPCIMTETTISLFGQDRLYETATVDCRLWDEDADAERRKKIQDDLDERKKTEDAIARPMKNIGS